MNMQIRQGKNPVLKSVALEVAPGERMDDLIDGMWKAMYQHKGIGLAANQVGELLRVVVVNVGGFKQEFINPVITERKGGQTTSKEGCLSFPNLTSVPVSRYRRITVEGFDRDWKPVKRKLKNLASFCVQHEIDHLNGITIG
jgi:peptide deformylase